jgi:penicillin-binding protein 2
LIKGFYRKRKVSIDEKYFEPVVEGMEQVVSAGTARSAYLPHIKICGKTGTAENPQGEDHSIFIAFAPKDNPQIAIAVYIENAGFGSTYAAPIASLMIEKYLTDSISRPYVEQRILDTKIKYDE